MWVVKSDNCWKYGAGGILNWEIPASRCLHSHEYTKLRVFKQINFKLDKFKNKENIKFKMKNNTLLHINQILIET